MRGITLIQQFYDNSKVASVADCRSWAWITSRQPRAQERASHPQTFRAVARTRSNPFKGLQCRPFMNSLSLESPFTFWTVYTVFIIVPRCVAISVPITPLGQHFCRLWPTQPNALW
jgi:hypothetical protein